MTSKDKQIWETYKQGLTPVVKKTALKPAAHVALDKREARKRVEKEAIPMPKIFATSQLGSDVRRALERKREQALRKGEVEIEAKLDLHGMTQIEAFEKLCTFMRRSVALKKRHLLIITGKGPAGKGVLRGSLETWLGQLPEAKSILAIRPAAAKHGGGGAFYVLLRKQ